MRTLDGTLGVRRFVEGVKKCFLSIVEKVQSLDHHASVLFLFEFVQLHLDLV